MSRIMKSLCYRLIAVSALCFTVILAIASSSSADVVGRYAFTTDASESITGLYNGTLMNGATVSGGSVALDGTSQYVDLGIGPTSFMTNLTGSCTFEAWVNWTGTGSLNQNIFDFGSGIGADATTGAPVINPHMYLSANYGTTGSGNLRYALEPAGTTKNNSPLNAPDPLGTIPTYIAVVYDASGRADIGNKTLYVNGVAVASFIPTAGGTPFPSSLTLLNNYAGKSQGDEINFISTYFGGSINDLRFWSNALSAADIASHSSNPAGANGLAVWTSPSGGNFSQAAMWDTGLVPDATTTALVTNGQSMDINGVNASIGGLFLYNGTILDSATTKGKLTSATAYDLQSGTISANLAGTGGMIKSAANLLAPDNTVILSGINTFSGGVKVNAGTLRLGATGALGASSNTLSVDGATTVLDIQNYNSTVSSLTLTGGATINSSTGSGTASITSTGVMELQNGSVSIKLSGNTGSLSKTTTSTVLLSGSNAYRGGTTVNAGILHVSAAGTLGANLNTNSITVNNGAILELEASGNIGGNQDLFINSGGLVSASYAFDQTQMIQKLGASGEGVLAISMDNANNFNFGSASSGPNSPVYLGARGGTYTYSGTLTPRDDNIYRLGGGGGTLNVNTNLVDSTSARSLRVAGGGSSGPVVLQGTGNTYSGGTTVYTGGNLQVASTSNLGSNIIGNTVTVQSNAVLNLPAETCIGSAQPLTIGAGGVVAIGFGITNEFLGRATSDSTGTIGISTNSSNALTFTSGVSIGASVDSTLSGTITPYNNIYRFGCGGAALTISSALTDGSVRSVVISAGTGGNVTFTPDSVNFPLGNTYTGGTTVNGGTLVLGNAVGLPTTGILTLNGGTANLGGFVVTVDGLLLNGGTLSGGTLASRTTYDVRSGTSTATLTDYTDPITFVVNPIGVTKTGTGTASLQAANSYTGKIVVQEGTLRISQDPALGTAPAALVSDAITLNGGTSLRMFNSVTVNGFRGIYLAGTANITEEAGYSLTVINSPITGPGGLTINGDSNIRFGLDKTYDGDTHILTGRLSLTFISRHVNNSCNRTC